MRELPALLADTVRPLQDQRASQNQRLELADHAILDLYRSEVIGVQAIGHVSKAFDELPHDWGDRTAWRLFNAPTYALVGNVAERPDLLVAQAREHDVDPARFHHPFQSMVAILAPPFAGSVRACRIAHAHRCRTELGKGGSHGGFPAQPRMPDRGWIACRRSRAVGQEGDRASNWQGANDAPNGKSI